MLNSTICNSNNADVMLTLETCKINNADAMLTFKICKINNTDVMLTSKTLNFNIAYLMLKMCGKYCTRLIQINKFRSLYLNTKINMKLKVLFTILIALFSIHFSIAQTQTSITDFDIVSLVTKANVKLNDIYKLRVSGQEKDQKNLQNAIYSANTELRSVRSFFADGNYNRYGGDIDKLQKYETELLSALEDIDETLSDNDLIKSITAVVTKAQSLNKVTKKLKKK